jgi:hypothetical protein
MPDNLDRGIDAVFGPPPGHDTMVGVSEVQPGAAISGLKHGPAVGVPPELAMRDPETVAAAARRSNNASILAGSPPLQNWATSAGAAKVAATQDDLGPLAKIGAQMGKDWLAPITGSWEKLQVDAKRYYAAASNPEFPKDLGEFLFPQQNRLLGAVGMDAVGVGLSPLTGLFNVGIAPAARGLSNVPTYDNNLFASPFQAPRRLTKLEAEAQWSKDLGNLLWVIGPRAGRVGAAEAGAAEGAAAAPKPGKVPPNTDYAHPTNEFGHVVDPKTGAAREFSTAKEAAQWILREGYADKANPQIFEPATAAAEGKYVVRQSGLSTPVSDVPPPGVVPEADAAKAVVAAGDAEHLAALQKSVAESSTHSAAPQVMAEFLEQQAPGKNVWVDSQKLVDLYREAGVTPGPGDGILGDVPGFTDDLARALQFGADLEVPLSEYLTATAGKPSADKLREFTRVREDGVSPDEGKALNEHHAAADKIVEEAAPAIEHPLDMTGTELARVQALEEPIKAAVSRAAKTQYLNQLFKTASDAGMTEDQFARYSKGLVQHVEAATKKMFDRAYAQIRRERKPDWQERLAQNKAAVEQELFARPDIQAQHYLASGKAPNGAPLEGPVKLNRTRTVAAYGEALTNRLGNGMFSAKGLDADAVAELFGYESGEQMLHAVAALEDAGRAIGAANPSALLKSLVEGRAFNATAEELGFDLTPEDITAAAQEAISDKAITDFLSSELKALGEKAGLSLDKEKLEFHARELYGKMPMRQAMNVKQFERTMGKTGRAAEVALMKGDYPAAFIAKQQQLLNNIMLAEAHKLAKLFVKTDKRFSKWARIKSSKSIDQMHLNYALMELARLGYPVRLDMGEILSQVNGVTLSDFIDARMDQGAEFYFEEFPSKPLNQMTVDEFDAARKTISSLIHNGRDAENVRILGKKAAFKDLIDEIKANAAQMGNKLTPERIEKMSLSAEIGKIARGINAPMIRMEQMLDELDLGNDRGPLNRSVVEPTQAAKAKENDLLADVTKRLKAFGKTQPKHWLGTMRTKVNVPELLWENPATGVSERRIITKGQVVKLALNWGNAGNRMKILEGYGWDAADVEGVFARLMTEADWKFVQEIWNINESLWPEIVKTYRSMTGVAPKRVEPLTVKTPFGDFKGGYYPIQYDKLRAPDVRVMSKDSIWGEDYGSALPGNAYTKGRTAYVAPISLNFEGLNASMGQVIHDIAFRQPLRQAQKVLENGSVKRAIQDNLGPEYGNQVRPWLEYVAREKVFDDRSTEFLSNFMAAARSNMTFVGLGYRLSSALIHGGVAAADSVAEVGALDLGTAIADIYRTPGQVKYWSDYISKHSPEVRHRLINMDQNIREAVARLTEKQGFLEDVQKYGYHMLALSDNFSAMPTWLAALRQEIQAGRPFNEAVLVADKRVRQAHGASAPVDLPRLQRGGHDFMGEVGKTSIGMFLSFMNHAYNRLWSISRQGARGFAKAKEGDWAGANRDFSNAAARGFGYVILPAVWVTLVHATQRREPLDNWNVWISGVSHTTVGSLPGVSMILDVIERGEANSPLTQNLETQHATINNLWKALTGDNQHVSKRWLQQALNTAGYWSGKVPGQLGTSAQYIWDFSTGAEHPKSVTDFIRGVAFGPTPKHKGKH